MLNHFQGLNQKTLLVFSETFVFPFQFNSPDLRQSLFAFNFRTVTRNCDFFELNPLDNKKDIGLYVLFRTFHDNFQVKLFPPKNYYFCILNVFILILFLRKMQLMNFKKKERVKHCYAYHILWRKALFMNNQYSIYLFYVFIVATSCYVNITLFYIECVLLDATSTTPVEIVSVVNG